MRRFSFSRFAWFLLAPVLAAVPLLRGAEGGSTVPKAPVPVSPFMPVIYRYADTLLERGRDTNGPQTSGLFLSALDRSSLTPLTNRPPAPSGLPENLRAGAKDGPLTGANLQHDENLLRLLFTLSELSAKPKYSNAAAAVLVWFLNQTPSTNTHLLPWGAHLAWDVFQDKPVTADGAPDGTHQFFRPWLLWENCFALAPEASRRFALALWEQHVPEHRTGAFVAQAGFTRKISPSNRAGIDSARQAGFCIRTWASAYARTRDKQFLSALETVLSHLERKRHLDKGWLEADVASTLSLAIDCDGAAHHVPEPLRSRLRALAAREDELFCALPHRIKDTMGFVTRLDIASGQPATERTALWKANSETFTTAQTAMLCVSRYDNTARVAYRELLHAAADVYRASSPDAEPDLWPGTLGQAISLQLAAWRSTAQAEYFECARRFGQFALEKFFDQSPLPRASRQSNHYEAVTGGDTLVLALLDLHLQILHITAVRCPQNTVDR